jgi:hypothetical protein
MCELPPNIFGRVLGVHFLAHLPTADARDRRIGGRLRPYTSCLLKLWPEKITDNYGVDIRQSLSDQVETNTHDQTSGRRYDKSQPSP